jgi:hypothetical protein
MSTPVSSLLALAAVAILLILGLAVRAFLRVTAGASGLRARIARIFLLPVRVRPLPRSHYFKAYWQKR